MNIWHSNDDIPMKRPKNWITMLETWRKIRIIQWKRARSEARDFSRIWTFFMHFLMRKGGTLMIFSLFKFPWRNSSWQNPMGVNVPQIPQWRAVPETIRKNDLCHSPRIHSPRIPLPRIPFTTNSFYHESNYHESRHHEFLLPRIPVTANCEIRNFSYYHL